jgi:RimJ/RimL family protein N-acetyltransferase
VTPYLIGKLIYVRGLTREDATGPMLSWTNDREVTRYLFRGVFPSTPERAERDFQAAADSTTDVEFAVVAKDDDALIGVAGLHSINWVARSGEFRVLIGEKQYWGKGCGTEAVQLMVAYGFEILNLHKVWLGVNSENVRAVNSYERVGFVREGELRDEIYRNSRYYNAIRMSILRVEYETAKKEWSIAAEIERQLRA